MAVFLSSQLKKPLGMVIIFLCIGHSSLCIQSLIGWMTIFGGDMRHAQTFATILYVGKSLIRVYEGEPMFDRTTINWVFPVCSQDPKQNPQCPNVKPTKEVVFLPFVCKVITTEDKGLHHCCGWHFWNPYQEGTVVSCQC